ncbi:YkgJ family cysteine cluster protein [Pseudodesulfovibrio sp.]|uniref:YkgJ family cysteine cluster protein n=1 Tax=unclassified Pseudodesulfovibrio TaxID=2661612 RepID=UPI003B00124C
MPDETKEFLASLPELEEGRTYHFHCHPGISCFNACCSDLTLVLTPYDILRLRRTLKMGSVDFLCTHTVGHRDPDTHFPAFQLRMTDSENRACPFVREEGCSIYADRPGACRMYPLGRATSLDENGNVRERFFIVREDHCQGFHEENEWTGSEWKHDQGFEAYTGSNDRYMRILARVKETGLTISDKLSHMAVLAMYKLDEFQKFIQMMHLFDRLEVDEERQKAILSDEEACLEFAMDWFEVMLFEDETHLHAKGAGHGSAE